MNFKNIFNFTCGLYVLLLVCMHTDLIAYDLKKILMLITINFTLLVNVGVIFRLYTCGSDGALKGAYIINFIGSILAITLISDLYGSFDMLFKSTILSVSSIILSSILYYWLSKKKLLNSTNVNKGIFFVSLLLTTLCILHLVNFDLDFSQVERNKVKVIEKRRGVTVLPTYYLVLENQSYRNFYVDKFVYDDVREGMEITLLVKTGLYNKPWVIGVDINNKK